MRLLAPVSRCRLADATPNGGDSSPSGENWNDLRWHFLVEARVEQAERSMTHAFGSMKLLFTRRRNPGHDDLRCRLRPLPPQSIKRYDEDALTLARDAHRPFMDCSGRANSALNPLAGRAGC